MPTAATPPPPGDVRAVGDAALRVAVEDAEAGRAVAEAVRVAGLTGVVEVVPSFGSVLVVLDPWAVEPERLAPVVARLAAGASSSPGGAGGRRAPVVLPVAFDGPDFEEVCRTTGLDAGALAQALCGSSLRVAVIGFSPGFAYLEGLPAPLRRVPRRATPRPVVPAGSLALAGGRAAVYPQATPGGWHLVGTTARRLFDPTAPPFALLQVGDTVRLAPAGHPEGAGSPVRPPSPPRPSPLGVAVPLPPSTVASPGEAAPAWEVEDPGMLTLVQDAGRRGVAHLGVPAAGPADPASHALGNRLVGNPDGAAALEATGPGLTVRALRPCFAAVVGPGPAVSVDGAPAAAGRLLPLSTGQRLSIGAPRTGLRSYVALAGGIDVAPVMGSRATDTLAWVGPGRLRVGQRLGTVRRPGAMRGYLAGGATGPGPDPDGSGGTPVRLVRAMPGPHLEWFPCPGELFDRTFVVAPASDRVGIRLRPLEGGPLRRSPAELDSEGMVTGAVQVPPDGSPVVLGPDHATLGGYPVAAVVITADLGLLAQCRPGDLVRLTPVEPTAARSALAARDRRLDAMVVGNFPVVPGWR